MNLPYAFDPRRFRTRGLNAVACRHRDDSSWQPGPQNEESHAANHEDCEITLPMPPRGFGFRFPPGIIIGNPQILSAVHYRKHRDAIRDLRYTDSPEVLQCRRQNGPQELREI